MPAEKATTYRAPGFRKSTFMVTRYEGGADNNALIITVQGQVLVNGVPGQTFARQIQLEAYDQATEKFQPKAEADTGITTAEMTAFKATLKKLHLKAVALEGFVGDPETT